MESAFVDIITSPHNDRVKQIRLLQTQAKRRRKTGRVVLEGVRLIGDALAAGWQPDYLLHTPDQAEALAAFGIESAPVADEIMREISDTQQPQGVIGVFPLPRLPLPQPPQHVLILDAIRDPGNLGTILRAAAAAGVQAVILAPGCVDAYNPKVLRAGMGAHFRVPLTEMRWQVVAEYCAGLPLYLADGAGDVAYDAVDWRGGWALIICGEAHGAGSDAHQLAQARVSIPMAATTESLNAAMAAAVLLFEAQRQRQ